MVAIQQACMRLEKVEGAIWEVRLGWAGLVGSIWDAGTETWDLTSAMEQHVNM